MPNFIKIEVEGAEGLVLQGGKNLAKQTKIKFLVEMHSNADLTMEDNANLILKWCSEVGYKAYYMKTKEEIETADAIKNRGRCHLLLLEKTVDFPEYLK